MFALLYSKHLALDKKNQAVTWEVENCPDYKMLLFFKGLQNCFSYGIRKVKEAVIIWS